MSMCMCLPPCPAPVPAPAPVPSTHTPPDALPCIRMPWGLGVGVGVAGWGCFSDSSRSARVVCPSRGMARKTTTTTTTTFQEALGGNSKTVLIVNVHSEAAKLEHVVRSLQFAADVKDIRNTVRASRGVTWRHHTLHVDVGCRQLHRRVLCRFLYRQSPIV